MQSPVANRNGIETNNTVTTGKKKLKNNSYKEDANKSTVNDQ